MLYKIVVSMKRRNKETIIFALDLLLLVAAFLAAQLLTITPTPSLSDLFTNSLSLLVIVPVGGAIINFYGLHRIKLNAYGLQGMIETATVATVVGVSGLVFNQIPGFSPALPTATFIVYALCFFAFCAGSRTALRRVVVSIYSQAKARKKVLIYGAGQTGQQLATALMADDEFVAVGFADDNSALRKLTICGLKIHAPKDIKALVRRDRIDRVVLAMPSASHPVRVRILQSLKDVGCEVLAVPSFAEVVVKGESVMPKLEPVELSKLLGRDKLEEEMPQTSEAYQGRKVLVTGAGGSIGSELCRQLLTCKPECIVLLEHSELALYNISRELEELAGDLKIVPVLGSIIDYNLVVETLETHEIEVILHAAAYKHVPLVEMNCLEGLRNNVLGTRTVADAARNVGVERFILVSSDKAVRPTSVMGATKRLAEMVIQDMATRSPNTRYAMVRFGNVLGSSGSVIPLFEDQIRRGGPVTVTHSDVSRYFMTVAEAVRLVLLAGTYARGGDVFVLDMGEPVVIRDVARQMIENFGYTVRDEANPHGDIEIEITGLRPGEKLHEELLIGSDMLTTPHPKILRAQEDHPSEIEMANVLQELRKAIDGRSHETALQVIRRWVESTYEEQKTLTLVNE